MEKNEILDASYKAFNLPEGFFLVWSVIALAFAILAPNWLQSTFPIFTMIWLAILAAAAAYAESKCKPSGIGLELKTGAGG